MSTSRKGVARTPECEVKPFCYPELSADVPHISPGCALTVMAGSPPPASAEAEKREADAQARGKQEGELAARVMFEEQLARERCALTDAVQSFAREREAYFQRVEGEIVQLSLSIARKILQRESQIDPVLLAGMVRVVLEKMESGTRVIVRVHPEHASSWREYFTRQLQGIKPPELIEDTAIGPEHCTVQTELGTTELGVEVQLKEIERGLLDLLAQRPPAKP